MGGCAAELVKIEIRLSPADRARLNAIAAAWGLSVSRAVARMVDRVDRAEFYGRAAALVGTNAGGGVHDEEATAAGGRQEAVPAADRPVGLPGGGGVTGRQEGA